MAQVQVRDGQVLAISGQVVVDDDCCCGPTPSNCCYPEDQIDAYIEDIVDCYSGCESKFNGNTFTCQYTGGGSCTYTWSDPYTPRVIVSYSSTTGDITVVDAYTSVTTRCFEYRGPGAYSVGTDCAGMPITGIPNDYTSCGGAGVYGEDGTCDLDWT